jgi:hypothetical protein
MRKIIDAHFDAIEEDMTDANKATVHPKMVTFSLAVSAEPMRGKTLLLLFLIDALADAGLLSSRDTRDATIDLQGFIQCRRTDDDEFVECLELDIDLNGLIEKAKLDKLFI